MIQQWIQKAPTEKLCIPKPNIFIPKDLSLKEAHEKVKYPAILRKTPLSRLWYKPDMLFSTPKVHIIIDFHCPLTSHSPEAVISTSLFVDLLADYLNAYGKHHFTNSVNISIFIRTLITHLGITTPTNCKFKHKFTKCLCLLQRMMLKLLVYSIQYIALLLDSRFSQ
jgi:hypothetical protein